MDINQIALQLYTLRENAQQDLNATLRQVSEIGYRAVELAGFYGRTAAELRTLLDQYGLKAASAHVALTAFETDSAKVFDDLQTLGCEYAIVPSMPQERRQDQAQFQQLAETLNRLGQLAQTQNLKVGYHNHAFEFAQINGSSLWDILINQTDPALVKLELDLYWVSFAGIEALELLETYPGRFPLLHLKILPIVPGGKTCLLVKGFYPGRRLLLPPDQTRLSGISSKWTIQK